MEEGRFGVKTVKIVCDICDDQVVLDDRVDRVVRDDRVVRAPR